MRKKFLITTELSGRERKITLIVYDRPQDLRAAASRYDGAPGSYKTTLGVVHGFNWLTVAADGSESQHPDIAIVRLSKTHLTPEVVAHEITHLASWMYQLDGLEEWEGEDLAVAPMIKSRELSDHFTTSNERFAYLMGALFATVWNLLDDEGLR